MATSDSPLSVPDVTLAVARGASAPDPGGDGTPVDVVEPTAEYFSDDFSSGDWNKPRPGDGVDFWVENQFGSIVTQSPADNPTVIFNGSSIYNELEGDPRDWTAKVGDNCLRVRYPANDNVNPIQVWEIQSSDAMPEIHLAFWIRVPVNFDKQGANNKLLRIWMDARSSSGDGATVGMSYRGTGGAVLELETNEGDFGSVGSPFDTVPWISVPDDRGRWMRMVFGAKAESSPGAADGWMKVWRRWEDESAFSLLINGPDLSLKLPDDPTAPQGWVKSEMMGYNNGAFPVDTEFLLDGIRLSPTPLVPAGTEGL